jgi:polyisoprenoid-binding protein YceI
MPSARRIALFAVPAALALAAVPMLAQGGPSLPGQPDKSRVIAGTYTADATHTLVAWKVNHFGFNDYFGLFGDVSGTLTVDPANPAAAKVDMTIPVSKITTVNSKLTGELLKPAAAGGKAPFFGAAPADATFKSTSVVPGADGKTAKITGDLTLNGVTKPVTLDAEFTGAGTNPFNRALTVGFKANTIIKRSDFGVSGFIPLVGDEVKLGITVAFEKKPAA